MIGNGVGEKFIGEAVASGTEDMQDVASQLLSFPEHGLGNISAQSRFQEQLQLENENLRLEVQRLRRSSAGTSDIPPSYSDLILS